MAAMKPVMVVAAAVIERQGKILICQRKRGSKHAFKWEFAGGKVETGETPAEALKRELKEELSIDAAIGEEMERYEFSYPGRPPIQLIFFRVREFEGEPENQVFESIEWTRPEQLPSYDFLDGDMEFVKRLVGQASRPASRHV